MIILKYANYFQVAITAEVVCLLHKIIGYLISLYRAIEFHNSCMARAINFTASLKYATLLGFQRNVPLFCAQ